jgi:hypothetical protein
MNMRWSRFNFYLGLLLAGALLGGCLGPESRKKRQPSTISVHLEVAPDGTNLNEPVPIYRAEPVMINVERTPFLTELNLSEAKVVDVMGGFAIRIQFDRQGTWLLEQRSVAYHGKRFAIFCKFGAHLKNERWLAAPVISRRIADGVLIFTPDATREEADEIVLGLNNVGREVEKKTKW